MNKTLLVALLLSACTEAKPSTLSGQLALTSFPNIPTKLETIDENGTRGAVALDPAGSFETTLVKGHTYRIAIGGAFGEVPLVFPRKSGRLDLDFKVSTAQAIVKLGQVRHFAVAPATGFAHKALTGDVECEDGFVQGTTEPCVDDDSAVECESGENDGECVDGMDAVTGAACTDADDDTGSSASSDSAMAVPEQNPPDDVSGCEDDEDDEDGEENDD